MASIKRYKVSKEQLERVVENFVMEAASIESKKAPVKNHIPSQGSEAKKHVKHKISGDMVEPSEGVPAKPPVMKKKLSQAADAKKHMSNAKATHSNKASVVKEEKEVIEEGIMDILPSIMDFIKGIDASQSIEIGGNAIPMKDFVTGVLISMGVFGGAAITAYSDEIKKWYENQKENIGSGIQGIKRFMGWIKKKKDENK